MASRTLGDRVEDLTKLCATFAEQLKAINGAFSVSTDENAETARAVVELKTTVALLNRQLVELAPLKDSLGTLGDFKTEIALSKTRGSGHEAVEGRRQEARRGVESEDLDDRPTGHRRNPDRPYQRIAEPQVIGMKCAPQPSSNPRRSRRRSQITNCENCSPALGSFLVIYRSSQNAALAVRTRRKTIEKAPRPFSDEALPSTAVTKRQKWCGDTVNHGEFRQGHRQQSEFDGPECSCPLRT